MDAENVGMEFRAQSHEALNSSCAFHHPRGPDKPCGEVQNNEFSRLSDSGAPLKQRVLSRLATYDA
jgi:hypothetical protein